MTTPVKLRRFTSVEEFKVDCNNVYMYFLDDAWSRKVYQEHGHFKRFRAAHPDLELQVRQARIPHIGRTEDERPVEN